MADQASSKSPASNRVPGPEAAPKLEIVIRKGDVRRAIRAADSVFVAARSLLSGEVTQGVVLMTAVLLVERLATASGREPGVVLSKMADCFAVKRELAKTLKRGPLA
jgi:hypothetical protein